MKLSRVLSSPYMSCYDSRVIDFKCPWQTGFCLRFAADLSEFKVKLKALWLVLKRQSNGSSCALL